MQKLENQTYIGLKMNSLTDKKIMEKLIKASKAGVKIDMVIRGICCLIAKQTRCPVGKIERAAMCGRAHPADDGIIAESR